MIIKKVVIPEKWNIYFRGNHATLWGHLLLFKHYTTVLYHTLFTNAELIREAKNQQIDNTGAFFEFAEILHAITLSTKK